MSRILLVYEDYTELMSAEGALKRVGLDVVGVTNEYSLTEQVLSFNPDAVVGFGGNNKVTSSSIGKKLKEMNRWQGKVVLIYGAMSKPTAPDLIKIRADIVLEAPLSQARLIQVLAKLLKLDENMLIEKLNKQTSGESPAADIVHVQGDVGKVSEEKFLVSGNEEPTSSLFGRLKNTKDLYSDHAKGGDEPETFFPDVDLKDIEFELTGAPVDKKVPTAFNLHRDEGDVETQLALKEELRKAQESGAERVSKYNKITEQLTVPAESTVKRVDARKRQKELQKDMDKDNLRNNDELRREFTKALFKK